MNKTFLVTAGPTQEKIDPVRFISNYSTGKMGFAIAEALADAGARVLLVCGPVGIKLKNPSITRQDVVSADEMYDACMQYFPVCQGAVLTAAVADYAPESYSSGKIKRKEDQMVLRLKPNRDIAAALGSMKKEGQLLVGFALETENEQEHAAGKLQKKNLDMIVLNSLRVEGAGFGHDTNQVSVLFKDHTIRHFPLKQKSLVARDIVNEIIEALNSGDCA